jgi:hypothetical protein
MVMRRIGLFFLALQLTSGAFAQMAPGIRPPKDVADATAMAWLLGCYSAASERPAPGLNMDFKFAGEGVHFPKSIPDDLRPLIMSLPGTLAVAVLDAPDGKAWMLHDSVKKRCLVVPYPASTVRVEAELLKFVDEKSGWKLVPSNDPANDKTNKFEQSFGGSPKLRTPAVTLRVWYQAANGPTSPQMIVTEQVSISGK